MAAAYSGISACLRPNDRVLRCGQHDFAVILPGVLNAGHALLAARKILGAFQAPLQVENETAKVRFAVGVTLFPDHGGDADQLLRKAQFALMSSETDGVPWAVSNSPEVGALAGAWQLESDLDEALDAGDLELYYQAQIDLTSGLPCGVEALARWNHPRHGLLLPDTFIPVADRSGRLSRLTQWAINTALRQSREWTTRFNLLPVAVNIPTSVAEDAEFPELLAAATGLWAPTPKSLTVEVTETSLLRSPQTARKVLQAVRELGVRVSIDDFGTGYSSLGQFRDLPADELKIDLSFVQAMLRSEPDRHIVKLVLELSQAFGLELVAEGVEDSETLTMLHALGCNRVQGYLMARPVPQAEFCQWLDDYPNPQLHAVLCMSTLGKPN